ncbi:hypothetical protein FSARC_3851 [Fusarium sarcochroum]|uniref:Mid2 domain-containing protein n=1 Tax=Fusarium sarcochroum TaxID=1208366 RepID=A0A8H4XBA8_9HYPO|nr:hypothetical protein FSARC_3851 [Fusarium sarcochroum]
MYQQTGGAEPLAQNEPRLIVDDVAKQLAAVLPDQTIYNTFSVTVARDPKDNEPVGFDESNLTNVWPSSTNIERVTSTTTSTTTMTSTTTRTSKETVYISDVSSEETVSSSVSSIDIGDAIRTILNPLDEFSTVTLSDVETSSSSSEPSMFCTITIGDLIPPTSTWSTSASTTESLDVPATSTQVPASAQVSLSKVEWIGIGVGIIVVLALIFLAVVILTRRRHSPRPAGSQNNINIQLDNGPFPRSGWDTSRSQLSVSRYTDSRELKTTFVPRPLGPGSPPPNYENLNQRYWTGDYPEYDLGVRGTEGEASGSRYAEGYSSAVYNDPKWKGKQREEY